MVLARAFLAACLLAPVAHAAPEAVEPTSAEWSLLEKGSAVSRPAPDLDPPGAHGWVLIEAEPETIWGVLNDPRVAVDATGSVTACEKYLDEPTSDGRKIGLHYTMNIAWAEIQYRVVRDLRPKEGWMSWTLDPNHTHDLVHTSGHYVAKPGKQPGTTLLTYTSKVDSGRNVPQWISNMLTGKALKGYLDHVKQVAEARQ